MTGSGTPGSPKRAHATLIGVPPPPPSRRASLPGIVVAPPPPPVRAKQPSHASLPGGEPLVPPPPDPVDLAFSRTVLATNPEVVPPELQAAVILPAVAPVPGPIVESAPKAMPAPLPESPVETAPATLPYQPASIERTPVIAAAAVDVYGAAASSRPRLRMGLVLAVTALAVVTGFGLTLFIGHATGEAPKTVPAAQPTPIASPSSATALHPSAAEPALKAAAVANAPAREPRAAKLAEASGESTLIPVSSATVSGCREMLGDAIVEKADPNAALAETQIGNRELVRGKVEASQAAFCKAALWDGAKVERWLNLAQLFLIRRDANKAVESSGRALDLDPRNARALEIQGDALARLGKVKEARLAYLAAEARPEPEEDALKWLVRRDLDEANRSLKSRDFVRAERLFRRVVVFDTAHAGAALGVATCLRKQNDSKAAGDWEKHAEMLALHARR